MSQKTLGQIAFDASNNYAVAHFGNKVAALKPWEDYTVVEQWMFEVQAACVVAEYEERLWMPIEKAPKDGKFIDVWAENDGGEFVTGVSWVESVGWVKGVLRVPNVTHWREPVNPPKKG